MDTILYQRFFGNLELENKDFYESDIESTGDMLDLCTPEIINHFRVLARNGTTATELLYLAAKTFPDVPANAAIWRHHFGYHFSFMRIFSFIFISSALSKLHRQLEQFFQQGNYFLRGEGGG